MRYTNDQVGLPPKTPITETGWAFCGIESSSILEPVLRVYRITGDPAALELGTYIVESGCCKRENIFEAIRQGKSPVEIGGNAKICSYGFDRFGHGAAVCAGVSVTGAWLERLVQNINFDDYEARNYFDLLLRRSGLFDRLEAMGIADGDTVDIYDMQFEYQR